MNHLILLQLSRMWAASAGDSDLYRFFDRCIGHLLDAGELDDSYAPSNTESIYAAGAALTARLEVIRARMEGGAQ